MLFVPAHIGFPPHAEPPALAAASRSLAVHVGACVPLRFLLGLEKCFSEARHSRLEFIVVALQYISTTATTNLFFVGLSNYLNSQIDKEQQKAVSKAKKRQHWEFVSHVAPTVLPLTHSVLTSTLFDHTGYKKPQPSRAGRVQPPLADRLLILV